MHPLALRGSEGTLWDAESFEVASHTGIIADDDVVFDTSGTNLDGSDATIRPEANEGDANEHTAVVAIQRTARGRIDGQKASRQVADGGSQAYRGIVHSDAQYAGQETTTAFFRGLLSRSHEVRYDETE